MIMTDENNLKQRLEVGLTGTPVTRPDERNKYMGTLRERIYLLMTVKDMEENQYLLDLKKECQQHSTATLLLNGLLDNHLLQKYMKIAQESHIEFTLITNHVSDDLTSIGLILTNNTAVNEPIIEIAEKYPLKSEVSKRKKGFFENFFK